MDIALEHGLCAEKVKVGSNNTDPGYAFKTVTLKRVMVFLCLALSSLSLGMLFIYRGAVKDRYLTYTAEQSLRSSDFKSTDRTIAQNLQLGAALAMQRSSKDDVLRLLKRIKHHSAGKIKDAKAMIPNDQAMLSIMLSSKLDEIEQFIDEERNDFEKEFADKERKWQNQIKTLQTKQIDALEKLKSNPTDMRLEILEELLEDLFERVEQSVEVSLPERLWADLEDLVDLLYQEDITLEKGLNQYQKDFEPFFQAPGIPKDLLDSIKDAREPGDLADVLDEIYEGVQIYGGRKQLVEISREWQTALDKESQNEDESEEGTKLFTKITVDTVIKVQKLINEGLIPQDFMDFEAVDLEGNSDDEMRNRL